MRHECDTRDTRATQVRQERHKCDTSSTRVLHERHECDTSVTRVTNFDFDNARIKTYFYFPIITIWQVKDHKERNNFNLRTTFWK